MRLRSLAVLRAVPPSARRVGSTVVRSMRAARPAARAALPGMPAAAGHQGACPIPVRRAGTIGDPSLEVLGLAGRRRSAGGRDGGARSTVCRRGDLGAARATAPGGARLRPGSGPVRGGRDRARSPGRSNQPARPADRPAGPPSRRRTASGHARRVRGGRPDRAAAIDLGRRRVDDRCHGRGLRRSARLGGRAPDLAGDGRARIFGGGPSIYSDGLSTGSVVARGTSPVVDASRGRNDPRKATVGRPSMARFRCKSCLGTGIPRSGRRC